MKPFSKLIFWLAGWKLNYQKVPELKRCVIIAAPHTSNWDFIFARAAFFLMEIEMKFMIKKEFIRFPFGGILKKMGAIPIDRSKRTNMVEATIQLFNERKNLVVMIPPEGTRGKVEKWKTGFYHTAVGAGVPIGLGYLDFKKKEAGIGQFFYPTGDIQVDFEIIRNFYKTITPEHPNLFDPESIRP
jgi:1-acyl-sn-glycerol-3-phosphate acyltransferase